MILIPYSVDEVLATLQFLLQNRRAGRPLWRTLLARRARASRKSATRRKDLTMPFAQVVREFLAGGVTYPWTLLASLFARRIPAHHAGDARGPKGRSTSATTWSDVS